MHDKVNPASIKNMSLAAQLSRKTHMQINSKKASDSSELDIFHLPSELKQNCFE